MVAAVSLGLYLSFNSWELGTTAAEERCTKRVGKGRHITELTLNNTVCVVASSICSVYFCTLESVARTLLLAHEQLKQGHVSILIRILVY